MRRTDLSSRGVLPSVVCLSDQEVLKMKKLWHTRGLLCHGCLGAGIYI